MQEQEARSTKVKSQAPPLLGGVVRSPHPFLSPVVLLGRGMLPLALYHVPSMALRSCGDGP